MKGFIFKALKAKRGDCVIDGRSYSDFMRDVEDIARGMREGKVEFVNESTKYEESVHILAALAAGSIVVPLCNEYGEKRNFMIQEQLRENKLPKDAAVILFTSGTGGEPKGVVLSEKAIYNNLRAIHDYMGEKKRKILIFRPLIHSAVFTGELLYALANGWDIVFWDGPFIPGQLVEYMKSHEVDIAGMTPTQLRIFLRMRCLPPLKEIILSGERLTADDARIFSEMLPSCRFYSVYGLTECGPRVSALSPEEFSAYPGSVGRPIKGVRLKIVHEELWVKTKSRMKGYCGKTDLERDTFHHGWIKTGDVARLSDGLLYVLGRKDDMIIRSGMNIYPSEIERVLMRYDGVEECVAYGKPDAIYGQKIVIDYVGSCSQEQLADYAALNLPAYLIPSEYHKKAVLKRTESGKLRRGKHR